MSNKSFTFCNILMYRISKVAIFICNFYYIKFQYSNQNMQIQLGNLIQKYVKKLIKNILYSSALTILLLLKPV